MCKITRKTNRGIGLIEVLITTVIIAVGLMAIASLQAELMGNSGENKIRAEAKMLCDNKLEQLRDAILKTGYDAIASSTADETITGSNEVFTRSWTVDSLPDTSAATAEDQTGPKRKRIAVSCSWGSAGADETVSVQSVITFEDLGSSSLAATTASGAAGFDIRNLSPNANSSDEIHDSTDVDISDATQLDNGLYTVPGLEQGQFVKDNGDGDKGSIVYKCSDLISFENGLYTRRVHYKPLQGTFKEAIELFEDNQDTLTCTRRIRFNGGIILPIKGVIYSRATTGSGANATLLELRNASGTQLFTFNATESGSYCVFEPAEGSTSAPYVCYVGGNCINGPVGTVATTDGITFTTAGVNSNTIVTQCPAPVASPSPTPPYPAGVYEEVGPGGWRGKVGLLGIPESSKNVCFAEELIAIQQQDEDQHTLDTARNYLTRRVNNGVESNEGVNRPYNCHDMVIINGQTTKVKVHEECIQESASIAGLALASKNIQRLLTGTTANSVILTPANTYCASSTPISYTVTGDITNAAGDPSVVISDGEITQTCFANPNEYTCSITTAASSLVISGIDSNGSTSCFITPPSNNGCSLQFTQIEGQRTVTVDVTHPGTGTITDIAITGTDATCIGTQCTVANDWTGTLTATANCSGTPSTVSGTSGTINANAVTASIELEACNESTTTWTISGTISIDSLVNDLTSVSVNINGSVCSGALSTGAGTSGTYSCDVPDGTDAKFEIAISPPLSNNNKDYAIAVDTYSSSGTGVLSISLGTINADQVLNGSITCPTGSCN